jgi:hypothetical protein
MVGNLEQNKTWCAGVADKKSGLYFRQYRYMNSQFQFEEMCAGMALGTDNKFA